MTHYTHVLTAAYLCVAVTMPVEASECFNINARTTKKSSTLVFEGTVTKVEELENDEIAVAMDVHRVWKGEVGKQETIYYPAGPLWGSPPSTARATTWLKAGERFVVFTNAAFEGQPKLARDRALWVAPCYGLHRPDTGIMKQLGRSRKPKGAFTSS